MKLRTPDRRSSSVTRAAAASPRSGTRSGWVVLVDARRRESSRSSFGPVASMKNRARSDEQRQADDEGDDRCEKPTEAHG
jgi:hypothetical protein